jgi:hypothetical protein
MINDKHFVIEHNVPNNMIIIKAVILSKLVLVDRIRLSKIVWAIELSLNHPN